MALCRDCTEVGSVSAATADEEIASICEDMISQIEDEIDE